jgi:ABC-type antimicrobial peptide transport system permease subunit
LDIAYAARRKRNLFQTDGWKRFRKNKLALFGFAVITLMVLMAVFAPFIAGHDPYESLKSQQGLILKNKSPADSGTLLGTDSLGRDVFSRVLYAARISMSVGLVAVGISTAVGILLGALECPNASVGDHAASQHSERQFSGEEPAPRAVPEFAFSGAADKTSTPRPARRPAYQGWETWA